MQDSQVKDLNLKKKLTPKEAIGTGIPLRTKFIGGKGHYDKKGSGQKSPRI